MCTDSNGYITTKQYITNNDVNVNSLQLNRLVLGTPLKILQYNVSGVLSEVDFPS
jgi:hypothetical protein